MPSSIEEFVFRQRVAGWSELTSDQKIELIDQARYTTYRSRGNGTLVLVTLATGVLSLCTFGLLPSLYIDSFLIGPAAAGLTCAVVFSVIGVFRAFQLLPQVESLVSELAQRESTLS